MHCMLLSHMVTQGYCMMNCFELNLFFLLMLHSPVYPSHRKYLPWDPISYTHKNLAFLGPVHPDQFSQFAHNRIISFKD